MSDRVLRVALAASCLAGAAVTGYLLSARLGSAELLCSTGGCETVQDSSYAELIGVPVAALGLAAYLFIGATALATGLSARAAGAAVALAAAMFSGYLLVIQLAAVGAVCDWCLASDVVVTVVAATALLRLRDGLQPAAHGRAA